VPESHDGNGSAELSNRELEAAKMCQDTFKHMTTVSTGAILLSSTVVGAFFPEPVNILFLWGSLVSFLLSAGIAMYGLYALNRNMMGSGGSGAPADTFVREQLRGCFGLAFLGALQLGLFFAGNFRA
jgi:hypothetical protein